MRLKVTLANSLTLDPAGWDIARCTSVGIDTNVANLTDWDTASSTDIVLETITPFTNSFSNTGNYATGTHGGWEQNVWGRFNYSDASASDPAAVMRLRSTTATPDLVPGNWAKVRLGGAWGDDTRDVLYTANGLSATYNNITQSTPYVPPDPVEIITQITDDGTGKGVIDITSDFAPGSTRNYLAAIEVLDDPGPTSPTITDVDGDEAVYPGQSFVITGTNFGATQGTGGVDIDGVAQTVTAWGDTSITCTAVRGDNEYGTGKTLTVTTDSATTATSSVAQEAEPGTAAVDVVNPVTTEDSIFYQVQSGTPATGQQIWHDDSPNTTANPDGTFEQTIVRDFNAHVWDNADSTWGTITLIQTNFDATPALGGLVYTESEVSGALTVGVVLDGTVSQLTSIDGTLGVTLPVAGDIEQGTAIEGTLTASAGLSGNIEQLTELEAAITVATSLNADTLEQLEEVVGTLSLTLNLGGTLDQATELEGTLDYNLLLGGTVEQQSELTGALAGGQIEFAGIVEQQADLEGFLTLPLELGGSLEQLGELEGSVVIGINFSGLLQQADFLSGTLIKGRVMAGSLLQPTQLRGTLSSTLPLNPLPIETLGIVSGQLLSPNLNSSGWLTLSDIYMHTDLTVDSIYFEPV